MARNIDLTKEYISGIGMSDGLTAGPVLERELDLRQEAANLHRHRKIITREMYEPMPRLLPRENLRQRRARLQTLSPFGQLSGV